MSLKCRICLFKTEYSSSVDLFGPTKTGELMSECLASFAPIEIMHGDGLPDRVCKNCEDKVNVLIDFRATLIASDNELRKLRELNESIIVLNATVSNNDGGKDLLLHSEKLLSEGRDLEDETDYQCPIFQETDALMVENDDLANLVCPEGSSNSNEQDIDGSLFTCSYCNKSFKFQSKLKEHLNVHNLEKGAYKCSFCDKVSDSFFESRQHWQEHFTDVDSEPASTSSLNVLPRKSKKRYEEVYDRFKDWCKKKTVKTITESVLLAYFSQYKNRKSSTLWVFYSILKLTLSINDNIDISKFQRLFTFLKRKSVEYQVRSSKSFTRSEIERFLTEAPDERYLMVKVALIIGVAGACRREDLTQLSIDDIEEANSVLTITLTDRDTGDQRTFSINHRGDNPGMVETYRKYARLRPPHTEHKRFFVNYRNERCTTQVVGIHTFGAIPKMVAKYLGLENPTDYTGNCFKKSHDSLLLGTGAELLSLKRKRRMLYSGMSQTQILF